ncbi:cytochrome P450, partial [Streptomyces brasiliscabiei]|uniref:cytochrome P450 n=1 Tax=Streptomyces brasiliscabiei TaxID=2736302 RepID=UPI003AF930CD
MKRVIGSAQLRYEHRTQMPYTDAVIHEIQRFANILPMSLPHETTEDVRLNGHVIPKVSFFKRYFNYLDLQIHQLKQNNRGLFKFLQ